MSTTTSTHRFRRFAGAAGLVALALVVPACGDGGSSTPAAAEGGATAPGAASAAEAKRIGATPIDVRTPDEYAAGHVTDAELIDVQSGDFADRIAELDPATTYVVYCRSGNRSAVAAGQMRDAGLTVLDGGALGDMADAGWPTT